MSTVPYPDNDGAPTPAINRGPITRKTIDASAVTNATQARRSQDRAPSCLDSVYGKDSYNQALSNSEAHPSATPSGRLRHSVSINTCPTGRAGLTKGNKGSSF